MAGGRKVRSFKVALFRPAEYLEETRRIMEEKGFEVLATPFIGAKVDEGALSELGRLDAEVLIITSQTAASILLNRVPGIFQSREVIAIGKKTAGVLERAGVKPRTPPKFDSASIYAHFREELRGRKIAILRSDRGNEVLLKLRKVAEVQEIQIYRIVKLKGEKQKKAVLAVVNKEVNAAVFSSRMMVQAFMEVAEEAGMGDKAIKALNEIVTIAIGPPTRDELRSYGVEALMPEEYTFDGVVDLLENLIKHTQS
jgi:uroporphyrinogen-III synthase